MRQPADWMIPSDDTTLELVREHGNLTPKAIEDLCGPTAGRARGWCPKLAEHGSLERISRGLYELTEDGEAYLNEQLDVSDHSPD